MFILFYDVNRSIEINCIFSDIKWKNWLSVRILSVQSWQTIIWIYIDQCINSIRIFIEIAISSKFDMFRTDIAWNLLSCILQSIGIRRVFVIYLFIYFLMMYMYEPEVMHCIFPLWTSSTWTLLCCMQYGYAA